MKYPTLVIRTEVLKSWLALSDYSNSDFAKEIGVSRSRISQVLGTPTEPSAHLMAKLLVTTGLPFNRLFRINWDGEREKGEGELNQVGRFVRSDKPSSKR